VPPSTALPLPFRYRLTRSRTSIAGAKGTELMSSDGLRSSSRHGSVVLVAACRCGRGVLAGVPVERLLAARRTEVIGLPVAERTVLSSRGIDRHSAYGIDCLSFSSHVFSFGRLGRLLYWDLHLRFGRGSIAGGL